MNRFLLYFTVFFSWASAEPIRVVVFSDFCMDSCGIAEHSRGFVRALETRDVTVTKLDFFDFFTNEKKYRGKLQQLLKWAPQAINIQCDSGWFGDHVTQQLLMHFLNKMKQAKIQTVITLHEEKDFAPRVLKDASDIVFCYQPKIFHPLNSDKHHVLELPALTFSPTCTKMELRNKYGYSDDDFIVSSCGTLYPQKKVKEIIYGMAPFLKNHPHVKVQLVVSPHKLVESTVLEMTLLKKTIAEFDLADQVYLAGKYTPTDEYLERLYISDLGFTWYDGALDSSSAVEKDFISTKVPLIVNNSTHFHVENGKGVLRVDGNLEEFIDTLCHNIETPADLDELSKQMDDHYRKNNYNTAVDFYLRLFSNRSRGSESPNEQNEYQG